MSRKNCWNIFAMYIRNIWFTSLPGLFAGFGIDLSSYDFQGVFIRWFIETGRRSKSIPDIFHRLSSSSFHSVYFLSFPSLYSPFYFFTYLLFARLFVFFNSKIGTLVVIVWPLVRSYFSFLYPLFLFPSPPFSLFIDGVALMPHSSPIGVKYGLAIGT